jgi:hypothetical protein
MTEFIERHWACGCPIGSKTCAYQNEPEVKDNLVIEPETEDKGFGWWWHKCGQQATKEVVEVEDD